MGLRRPLEGALRSGYHYGRYRPRPPRSVVDSILSFLRERLPPSPASLCLDVGCGAGQAGPGLAPHFARVLGCDVSQSQIDEARRLNTCPNVEYRVCGASALPAGVEEAQLVSVVQAAHYLDWPAFLREADRVLCRGGVLALVFYGVPRCVAPACAEAVSAVIRELHSPRTGMRWSFERLQLEKTVAGPRFRPPYEECRVELEHTLPLETTVEEFLGYVSTWSAYQELVGRCGEERGRALLQEYRDKILSAAGSSKKSSEEVLKLEFPYYLLMGRKP